MKTCLEAAQATADDDVLLGLRLLRRHAELVVVDGLVGIDVGFALLRQVDRLRLSGPAVSGQAWFDDWTSHSQNTKMP